MRRRLSAAGQKENKESKVQTIEKTIQVERTELLIAVFGAFDENIKLIERELGVSVVSRGGSSRFRARKPRSRSRRARSRR